MTASTPTTAAPPPVAARQRLAHAWRSPAAAVARREVRSFVELFAVSGFAIAQPLYDIFGRAPDQFIFRGALTPDILWFAALVLLAPAVLLYAGEAVVGLVSQAARRSVHAVLLALLAAVFAVGAIRSLFTGPLLVVAGLAVGALVGVLYVRTRGLKIWLSFLAVAPPVFCAIFLLSSQTATLLSDPAAAGDIQIRHKAPVVMIVFDELPLASLMDRDGRIDADLYPNFAALAATSHWFRNTTSVSNFTLNAVPAIVTGKLPRDGTTPTAASHPDNLFTLLGGSMGLEVTESVTRLCPTNLCATAVPRDGGLKGLLRDARKALGARISPSESDQDPTAGLVEQQAPTDEDAPVQEGDAPHESGDRAQAFLDGIRDDSNTVHFLHILLPHVPFRYLPDGTQYAGPNPDLGRDGEDWQDQPWLVTLSRQRHLMQLAYADRLVGETIAKMKGVGLYDDAVLTVVADHGISFQPGEGIRGLDTSKPINDSVASEIMWVPFFLKEPGQDEGDVTDDNVLTIDVVPTIADVLDVDLPYQADGRSALGAPRTTTKKSMYQADHTGTEFLAGKPYTLDEDEGWDLVLSHAVDRFLPKGGEDRLWRIGPDPDLVGREPGAVDDATLAEVGATLDDTDLSDMRPDSGTVPALVRATLTGVDAGDDLAVAIDGTIVATAPAYAEGGAVRLAVMVPDTAYRAGKNTLAVYRITS